MLYRNLIYMAVITSLIIEPAVAANSLAIEEVIVSAQKRLQSIQEVPIAITAFSEDTIQTAGITSLESITLLTPGLALSSYNQTTPAPYVRGIGTNNSHVADDPSVAIFIDDIYISRPGSADTTLFDLERIEVLRGPQGTLWGKNVAGGALVFITRQPSSSFEGKASITAGNFARAEAGLYLNGPVSGDNLLGKITITSLDHEGYIDNTRIGGEQMDEEVMSMRSSLLWTASDDLEVLWSLDGSRDRASGSGRILEESKPGPSWWPVALPPNLGQYDETETFDNGYMDRDIIGTSLKISYEKNDIKLTSITAARKNRYKFFDALSPLDLNPIGFGFLEPLLTNEADEDSEQWSQELRINQYIERSDLEWTAGLFFFTEDIDREEFLATQQADAKNTTDSLAVFGQIQKQFTNDWAITIGGRYTDESKDFEQLTLGAKAKESWDELTAKFSVDYKGFDQGMIYFSYSEGFKSGAFNAFASNIVEAETPLDPELSTLLEAGIKSHWFEQRLQANLVVFTTDYSDIQVFDNNGLIFNIVNAEASSDGIELELHARPLEGLLLSATYAYLDAEYDKYQTNTANYSGNRLQRAPKNSYSLSAQYTIPMNNKDEWMVRADLMDQSEVFYSPDNNPNQADDGHSLLNLRLSYHNNDGQWQISLWSKNVTGEEYVVFENDLAVAGLPGFRSSVPGPPRTYGLTVDYHL